jgi:hypothetical protein
VLYCYAKLTEEQLAKVRAFEAKSGKKVLALRYVPIKPEDLTPEEAQELDELEQELRMVLLVVK